MLENKINCKYKEHKRNKMVHPETLCLEEHRRECNKDEQCNHLLYNLKLDEGERTSVHIRSNAVCRHLETILKEGNEPAYGNYPEQAPLGQHLVCPKLQMTVPRQSHETVGNHQQQYSKQSFSHFQKTIKLSAVQMCLITDKSRKKFTYIC